MALIKCPECGREVSDKALSCPNCGTPINSSAKYRIVAKGVASDTHKQSVFCEIIGGGYSMTAQGATSRKVFSSSEADLIISRLSENNIKVSKVEADFVVMPSSSQKRCWNCGEVLPSNSKGYSFGKGALGVALFGAVGAVAGINGKSLSICPKCGKRQ